MTSLKGIAVRVRTVLMYLIAVGLVILIPLTFFFSGSGLMEKIGKKIPIKEGTFDSGSGQLKAEKPVR